MKSFKQFISESLEDSPNFRAWFGDSIVIDGAGHPLVVYHGTRKLFNAFEPFHPSGAIGNPKGIYFTADRSDATRFSEDVDGATDEKSRVLAVYLSINSDQDGIILDSSYRGREYVVFDPTKIKSATSNNGNFDPTDSDITH